MRSVLLLLTSNLLFKAASATRLESIDNLDTADVTSASLSAGEQGSRVPLVTATNVAGMPDTPFNLREGNAQMLVITRMFSRASGPMTIGIT